MSDIDFERLKLLHEYTKFHIALYTTLITGLIPLMSLGGKRVPHDLQDPLVFVTVMFVLAGACGGIVATNSVKFNSIDSFRETWIGPLALPILPGKVWASLEHVCFWVGIGYALYRVARYQLAT